MRGQKLRSLSRPWPSLRLSSSVLYKEQSKLSGVYWGFGLLMQLFINLKSLKIKSLLKQPKKILNGTVRLESGRGKDKSVPLTILKVKATWAKGSFLRSEWAPGGDAEWSAD